MQEARSEKRSQYSYPLVLCYHAVIDGRPPLDDFCFLPRSNFRAQIRFLSLIGARVLSVEEAVRRTRDGTLPPRSVVVTFDDGFKNNIDVALPVLTKAGMPATIYVNTAFTDTAKSTWASRLTFALSNTEKSSLSFHGEEFDLSSPAARVETKKTLSAFIKENMAGEPWTALDEIEASLDVEVDPDFPSDSIFRMLGADQIREASDAGHVSFAAHTRRHPIVSALDDDALLEEIDGSIKDIERITGRPTASFAFPNGRQEDFDDRSLTLLADRGIDIALTTSAPNRFSTEDPVQVGRFVVGSRLPLAGFASRVLHAFWKLR
ncbi:polysaccharide deacetylase family protein [Silicimonas sp. MF1-12-2]|uniref:polysaccharide deacetylase family protein n=1 Tax=Silicimonas sp. MF1-12-2 TaxID=3384793 RepID=UPI0039B56EC4